MNLQSQTIRYGQILERVTGKAIELAGYSFRPESEYDPIAVNPDFLMPADGSLNRLIEVTQTEDRGSFRMKILRYFELVAGAKVHFGSNIEAISFIYGTPDNSLPATNLRASISFFDATFLPRIDEVLDQGDTDNIAFLEQEVWKLAGDENISGLAAAESVINTHANSIDAISRYLSLAIPTIEVDPILTQLFLRQLIY